MQLLQAASLLAASTGLDLQPVAELVGEGIQLAGASSLGVRRLDDISG